MIRTPADMPVETREHLRDGDGTVTLQHLFNPSEFGARVRLCARLTLPPGASIGPHAHEGEDEIYLLLEGEGLLEDDGETRTVRAGDAVLTGRGASHSIRNAGEGPLVLLAVILLYPDPA